jgi:hypothetical protein
MKGGVTARNGERSTLRLFVNDLTKRKYARIRSQLVLMGNCCPETNYLGGGSVFLMTLYHFHEPKYEDEANAWLVNFLLRYNDLQHRSEPHSRMEDWLENLPSSGVRALCSWERFCTFAREPERRKVVGDTRISVAGVNYEVDPDLAGETVMLRSTRNHTSAGCKIASGSKSGENAIPGTGAKRTLQPKNRYKISARLK